MPLPSASVIMLEFNELTPSLMNRFMAAGDLPNFKRFHDEAQVYVTDAEEDGDNLQPWVQWVTVHTGVSASAYGITRLSDGHKLEKKAIWDFLSEAGLRVWVCGSMNARYDKPLNGYLLPDPWSTGLHPYPVGEMDSYYRFVRNAVQEHTNEAAPISKGDLFRFLKFMLMHGLSFATVRSIMSQLWTERRTKKYRWRRAAILDQIQWDVFRHYYRKLQPQFSSFFINSTAHFQHTHWRNMDPELFQVKPSANDQAEFKDAILYGYQKMDRLIGRFMALAGKNTTLIFCTGLSQQAYADADDQGGRHFYRIKNPAVLKEQLGLGMKYTYLPVMAEQFVMRFDDEDALQEAQRILQLYRVGNRLAFHFSAQGLDLMVQCNQTGAIAETAVITQEQSQRTIPFYSVFYPMENLKSGHHHPDGMLWIRNPDRNAAVHQEKVSLRSIAPSILEMFHVPRPDYMDCRGFNESSNGKVAVSSSR